ncbi:unnamed protein product [Didymodactylos carnosus]|uniref:WGR domain-containing protein n=1 Tax=Didymodactylos carnosus TaxID=1234261 RepID=A0A815QQ84_9BILA|nr:unnamed protein product [Didymodactylos carnosus]CAF1465202.1 unnamed protein product [Didymodactylos carnosus]CAF3919833.1 unnamed protein product [Didymodactylos carnosus]CAF4334504.1 unnamed protein product [Didymodactylos carnosus]
MAYPVTPSISIVVSNCLNAVLENRNYESCILQALKLKDRYDKTNYYIWMRWRRRNGPQQTDLRGPYKSTDFVVDEFERIFETMTNNQWQNRHNHSLYGDGTYALTNDRNEQELNQHAREQVRVCTYSPYKSAWFLP